MLDRISQVILIIVGILVLFVLTVGLAISCRQQPAQPDVATATPTFLVFPTVTVPSIPTATPTPLPGPPTATPTPLTSDLTGPTATPTPLTGDLTGPTVTLTPPISGGGGLAPGTTIQHTVNRGEWLLQIARCYGTAYSGILASNVLPNPDLIFPGQVITVPNIGSQGRIIGSPCVQAHVVEAGETWESMATRFGTTVAILRRANPGELSVGWIIWAPRP